MYLKQWFTIHDSLAPLLQVQVSDQQSRIAMCTAQYKIINYLKHLKDVCVCLNNSIVWFSCVNFVGAAVTKGWTCL